LRDFARFIAETSLDSKGLPDREDRWGKAEILLSSLRRRPVVPFAQKQHIAPPSDERMVLLPDGFPGAGDQPQFLLYPEPGSAPFQRLEGLQPPHARFLLIPPSAVTTDYAPSLSENDLRSLKIEKADDAMILNLVTLEDSGGIQINLERPLVFNRHTRIGKQIIPTNAEQFHRFITLTPGKAEQPKPSLKNAPSEANTAIACEAPL
jgi:flagellar assembly factor FliW